MEIDARKLGIPEENCEQMKTVASKVGVQVVCSEDDAGRNRHQPFCCRELRKYQRNRFQIRCSRCLRRG